MSTKTNLNVIYTALRLINVVPEGGEVSAEQGELGLQVLNEFLEDWSADGIEVGHWPQDDVNAEYPGDRATLHTVQSMLAVYLAPHYEREAPPTVIATASAGYQRLLRDAAVAKLKAADMSHLPGFVASWDIYEG